MCLSNFIFLSCLAILTQPTAHFWQPVYQLTLRPFRPPLDPLTTQTPQIPLWTLKFLDPLLIWTGPSGFGEAPGHKARSASPGYAREVPGYRLADWSQEQSWKSLHKGAFFNPAFFWQLSREAGQPGSHLGPGRLADGQLLGASCQTVLLSQTGSVQKLGPRKQAVQQAASLAVIV